MNQTKAVKTTGSGFEKELVCAPELQRMPRVAYAAGFIIRVAIGAAAVTGLLMFISDAFALGVPWYSSALITLYFTAVFSLLYLGAKGMTASALLLVAGGTAFALTAPDGLHTVPNGLCALWNLAMKRLSSGGYRTLPDAAFTSDAPAEKLAAVGLGTIGFILALIFTTSLARKTRLLPMFCSGLLVVTTIFTYNISRSNWGFALVLAALCGIITLKLYDRVFDVSETLTDDRNGRSDGNGRMDGQDKDRDFSDGLSGGSRSALGGFAGGASFILAGLILIFPALNIHESWTYIESIDRRLQYARAVVASVIVGETPNLNDLGFLGNMDTLNARDTNATTRSFTGAELLELHTSYDWPVYLRSWIGSYYIDDMWYSAVSDDVAAYNKKFGSGFSPDDILYDFYELTDPSLVSLSSLGSSSPEPESGLIMLTADVRNLSSSGNLLFLPTFTDRDTGLLEYGARDYLPYAADYKYYFDGIVTTSWFNFNKSYRAVTLVPTYRSPKFSAKLREYETIRDYMEYYITFLADERLSEEDEASYVELAESALSGQGIEVSSPTALERFFELDEDERDDYVYENFTLPDLYGDYASSLYTEISGDDRLRAALGTVAKEIIAEHNMFSFDGVPSTGSESLYSLSSDGSVRLDSHKTALAVIDYLKENYTYSLSPRKPSSKRMSVLEAFLTDTKEGYCVQFATSAAMLLRSFGIPARYVEGYIASSFTRESGEGAVNRYVSTVRDYNAHAWIEVWREGVGWMQYETTPEYYDGMYLPFEEKTSSGTSGGYDELYEEEIPEEDDFALTIPAEAGFSAMVITTVLLSAAAVTLAVIFTVRFVRRSKNESARRAGAISSAIRGDLGEDEAREVGGALGEYIMKAYRAVELSPGTGELPSEFAKRASDALAVAGYYDHTFPEVMEALERERYGRGMTRGQLKLCGEYLLMLRESAAGTLPPLKRFWHERVKLDI